MILDVAVNYDALKIGLKLRLWLHEDKSSTSRMEKLIGPKIKARQSEGKKFNKPKTKSLAS